MKNIRVTALKGVLWSSIERFASQLVSFSIMIVVARKLNPQDYGLMAMPAIFMAVAQSLVDSGLSNALIQKQKCNSSDYSTVFWFNISTAAAMFCILTSISPIISRFYGQPLLRDIIPALALTLVIGSFSSIQRTLLTIGMEFRQLAKVTLTSAILSGILAIYMAHKGYGVWALVAQSISNSLIQCALLWHCCKWKPEFLFSRSSFRHLFSFGSRLLASGLMHTVYTNLYSLLIGKIFSAGSLGLFSNAQKLSSLPSANISGILSRVMYPIMCSVQDNPHTLADKTFKMIEFSSYFIFPAMASLAILAEPLIDLLLTEKWDSAAPLVKIISLAYMWDCIMVLLGNAVNARGRSDYFFSAEIWKKFAAITFLLASIPFGITGMCWSLVLYSFADIYIITRYSRKTIPQLTLSGIAKCIISPLLYTLLMSSAVMLFTHFIKSPIIQLSGGTIIGITVYITSIYLLSRQKFKQLCKIISYQ